MIANLVRGTQQQLAFAALCGWLLMSSSPAWAGDIHKCVDEQGSVSYSDKPCSGTETATTMPEVRGSPADLRWPASQAPSPVQAQCAADRQAMREKTVPLSELEKVKNRIQGCLLLEMQELERQAQADRKAEAEKRQAEIARMSPKCQARWQELIDLQVTMETPDEINRYIKLGDIYRRKCEK
ncbi:MAG: DUF4124 domain-containing protein [Lysobacterales bacterium]